jgi:hypothetical protein
MRLAGGVWVAAGAWRDGLEDIFALALAIFR